MVRAHYFLIIEGSELRKGVSKGRVIINIHIAYIIVCIIAYIDYIVTNINNIEIKEGLKIMIANLELELKYYTTILNI